MLPLWWFCLGWSTAAWELPARPSLGRRAAVATERELSAVEDLRVTVARSPEDWEECGKLCLECFPTSSAARHARVLRAPGSLANIFFDAAGHASVGMLTDGSSTLGCAQLVPCVVRSEASAAGGRGFWVQYVCVTQAARRRGVATALMAWCEREAGRAAAASRSSRGADVWLAAREDNAPALALYARLGFRVENRSKGHVLMRKLAGAVFAAADGDDAGPAADFDLIARESNPWTTVTTLAGPSMLLAAVALVGAACMIAPFHYDSPAGMFADLFVGGGAAGVAHDLVAGLVAAAIAEFFAARLRPARVDALADLERDPSLATQSLGLWDVTVGASTSATAPIAVWQLVASAAEEFYYRGLLLNGIDKGLGGLGAPAPLAAAIGLFFSTALFALAHTEWVAEGQSNEDARKLDWLRDTAPFGLLFGLLFLAQGDRILAPVVAHAALNTYWCVLDAQNLQAVHDRQALADIFNRARASRLGAS